MLPVLGGEGGGEGMGRRAAPSDKNTSRVAAAPLPNPLPGVPVRGSRTRTTTHPRRTESPGGRTNSLIDCPPGGRYSSQNGCSAVTVIREPIFVFPIICPKGRPPVRDA